MKPLDKFLKPHVNRPVILTVSETASFLLCSEATILRLIHADEIPAFRCGKLWRLDRDEVMRALSQRCKTHIESPKDSGAV